MHPPLHNEAALGCVQVIEALEECHARGFVWKALGNCSDLKIKVNACLRAQRVKDSEANRTEAQAKRDQWRQTCKDLGL